MSLSCRVIESSSIAQYSVIWLHGFGGNPDDVMPWIPQLELDSSLSIRHIFPIAPAISVTFLGYYIPSWYDIKSVSKDDRDIDEQGFLNCIASIHELISQEVANGIPASHIFIAGFSQGGAVAYAAGLSYPEKLAGIIGLATYMPHLIWHSSRRHEAQSGLPVLIIHGKADGIVPIMRGRMAHQLLRQWGYQSELAEFDMEHEVTVPALQCISTWLQQRIPQ